MDTLCDQSLFSKRRRVCGVRVNALPLERVSHFPIEQHGLRLVHLQWNVDESVQPASATIGYDASKLNEVQDEQAQEEVSSATPEIEIDGRTPEPGSVVGIKENNHPAVDSSVIVVPDGIQRCSRGS